MKVLFVGSGNKSHGEPSILIRNQAISLKEAGVSVEFFVIQGKGLMGYIKNCIPLRKRISDGDFDVIHAHYSLSGIAMTMASLFLFKPKKVVSLMGSDAQVKGIKRLFLRFFIHTMWNHTIVKTKQMALSLGIDKAHVIPNGVNLQAIVNEEQPEMKTILFAADPSRPSKNYQLASDAFEICKKMDASIQLKVVFGVSHDEILLEIKKSSCVLVTSLWEGSPNIVKEAMACQRPIVSTNVGDVSWLLDGVDGCYITNWDKEMIARSVSSALLFSTSRKATNGRDRLVELGLDSKSITQKIIELYKNS